MRVKVVVHPTAELITLDECRQHLEVVPYSYDSDDVGVHPDDALIMDKLKAAREHCEAFLGFSIAQKTYEGALDEWPTSGVIELPKPPLVSVESVTVGTGSDAELDPELYVVDDYSMPARLVPVSTWPHVTASTNVIKIRWVAGYGDGSDDEPLPYAIRAAMLLLLGDLYRNREDSVDRAQAATLNGVEALLRPLRVRLGMA